MNQVEIREITLPSGQVILATVHVAQTDSQVRDVSFPEDLSFAGVTKVVNEIASSLLGALSASFEKAIPGEVGIEFGLSLAVKSGRLTGFLVDGSSEATLKITLKWQNIAPKPKASEN